MEIKEKILVESFKLFLNRGIKSVSMDDIALKLGASKKTIYKWFQNKDEIVGAALQAYLGDMNQDCQQFSVEAQNAVEELFNIMGMMRKRLAGVHHSVFYDLQKYHPKAYQLWVDHKNNVLFQQIVANLKRGIEEGLYRSDIDIEILARLRLLQTEHSFNPEFFPPDQFNMQKVQLAILDHFMMGIASLKGHKLINKYKEVTEVE
ncbi:TetR/AcrR family transcriptional regulator [Adhaeribacter aquaticus]|uniref:TetR/AcrR family transcriptional regulator n=1 Tax=Adhaeribacter aquaticus TaxID=299567 RepID=UPI0003FA0EC7|nr:TetR/AcrR family transcriptional regulator [Adhaeribacter aquaticus]